MPWLSRQNSDESVSSNEKLDALKEKGKGGHVMVTFLPAQIDGLCGTRAAWQKATPVQLFTEDIRVLIRIVGCVPGMLMFLYRRGAWRQYLSDFVEVRETILQLCLGWMQCCMLCAIIPTFMFLPGVVTMICVSLCWMMTVGLSWGFNGEKSITTKWAAAPMTEDLSDERWFFINGPMTSKRSLRAHCSRISKVFSRPITGIHNSTHGPVLDFLGAIFIRSTHQSTGCTRTLASQLRDACLNNSVRKVIVLGHSTGCIHISLALDILHSDLPTDVLSKFEIYTFGSAAHSLSNPLNRLETLKSTFNPTESTQASFTRSDGTIKSPVKATLASLGHRIEDHERVVPHVEHYAYENDLFARWGVLNTVRNVLDGRYCGRVFMTKPSHNSSNGDGFLFDHYMDGLFPATGRSELLDSIVKVDRELAEKREFTAMGVALPMKSIMPPNHRVRDSIDSLILDGSSSPDMSPKSKPQNRRTGRNQTSRAEKRTSWGTAGALGIDGVGKARACAKECEGRTVRQLSRLWRYRMGARPVGEGVAVLNGVGHMNGHGMVQ